MNFWSYMAVNIYILTLFTFINVNNPDGETMKQAKESLVFQNWFDCRIQEMFHHFDVEMFQS